MIEEIEYRGYKLYFDTKNPEVGRTLKQVIDKNFKIDKIYKDTERNYVVKIKLDQKFYVLKSPKAETIIPQRKIQTLFKKGEALTSLINLTKHRENGFSEFIVPLGVILKRDRFIKESFILMEYIECEPLETEKDIEEVIKIMRKVHEEGIYHGDLNISNFIKTQEGIKIIDTQGKESKISSYRQNYDMLTLKKDLLIIEKNFDVEKIYPLERKSFGYGLAYLVKEFKHIALVKKIRSIKKGLRKKGWKF